MTVTSRSATMPRLRAALARTSPRQWWTAAGILLAMAAFAVLADGAKEGGDLSAVDPTLHDVIVEHRSTWLTPVAQAFTFFANLATMAVLTGAVLAYLLVVRRDRWRAAIFATAMAGSAAMTYLGKLVIGRHRPDAQWMMNGLDTEFSFPSGHTLNATVFTGVLTVLVWRWTRDRRARVAALAAAVTVSVGVGLSRLYLGYHWFTDVLGGWVLGAGWVAAIALVLAAPRAFWGAGDPAQVVPGRGRLGGAGRTGPGSGRGSTSAKNP